MTPEKKATTKKIATTKATAKTTAKATVKKAAVKKTPATTKKAAKKAPVRSIPTVKVNIYNSKGKKDGTVDLPECFNESLRLDLIRKSVRVSQANRRQPYGASKTAGMMHAVSTLGKGTGRARVQRLKDGRTGAETPGNVGGRKAHPPKVEKDWSMKMNRKEARIALLSALSATTDQEMVSGRGHTFSDKITVPVVVDDKFEKLEKISEAIKTLEKIGIYDDVVRAKDGKHIRPGKGTMRGRPYKQPKSILFVLSRESDKTFLKNLPGVDITTADGVSTEALAPGGDPGRLMMISNKALDELKERMS